MSSTPILYAPNVNIGGGLVLLKSLLNAWPPDMQLRAFLDTRVRGTFDLSAAVTVDWVEPQVLARFAAQCRLRAISRADTTVLCFNGLPPLLPNRGRIVVFVQNRLHLVNVASYQYAPKVALRLAWERFVSHALRHRVHHYVVQTPSMARALARWYGNGAGRAPDIAVVPFAEAVGAQSNDNQEATPPKWDFIYVADGLPHKNHRTLCEAWRLLAEQGIRPRLALTLAPEETRLLELIAQVRARAEVQIVNLGRLTHGQVLTLYGSARALIFPSLTESFGLPLVEARQSGLPIIASELDFVRDVCTPAQTFDPQSAVSIARAVCRFLNKDEVIAMPAGPRALWNHVLGMPGT